MEIPGFTKTEVPLVEQVAALEEKLRLMHYQVADHPELKGTTLGQHLAQRIGICGPAARALLAAVEQGDLRASDG